MLVKDRLWIKHLRISCISFILELLLLGFLSIFFFVILVEWTRLIDFFNAYWIVHSYIRNVYWVSCCMIKLIKIFLYFKTHLKSFLVLKKKKKTRFSSWVNMLLSSATINIVLQHSQFLVELLISLTNGASGVWCSLIEIKDAK